MQNIVFFDRHHNSFFSIKKFLESLQILWTKIIPYLNLLYVWSVHQFTICMYDLYTNVPSVVCTYDVHQWNFVSFNCVIDSIVRFNLKDCVINCSPLAISTKFWISLVTSDLLKEMTATSEQEALECGLVNLSFVLVSF